MARIHLQLSWLIIIALSGCAAKVPFTHEMRTEYSLTHEQLQQLQYYVSAKLVLQREMQEGEVSVTPSHRIRIFQGKRIDEIVITAKTPGICETVRSHFLRISFEEGGSMDFGCRSANGTSGNYAIYGSNWGSARGGNVSYVSYRGVTYKTSNSGVHLLINIEQLKEFEKSSRRLPGRRLRE